MNHPEPMTDRPISEIGEIINRFAGAVSDQENLAQELRQRLGPVIRDSPAASPSEVLEKRSQPQSPIGRELTELADRVETNNRLIRELLADCQV